MQSQNSLKREFLKKWVMGFEKCNSSKEKMSLLERKNAIKLSADLAMASTRNGNNNTRSWSHALIAKASTDSETGSLAKRILGPDQPDSTLSQHGPSATFSKHTTRAIMINRSNNKKIMSRKIHKIKRNTNGPRKCSGLSKARSVAKRLVKKRTQILRGLVPGGEDMDEYYLIKEALDYLVSLRAQVDVMHHLANNASSSSSSSS